MLYIAYIRTVMKLEKNSSYAYLERKVGDVIGTKLLN